MYVEIAPAIPLFGKNQAYTYEVGEKVLPGTIVTVPFGKRSVQGVVISATKKPPYRTRSTTKIYSHVLTPEQIAFASQIARYCGGGLGYTLRLFFPPSLVASKKSTRSKLGAQHLIIIPERWMTSKFPKATSYHAGLAAKERLAAWKAVSSGEAVTIVGTQKALYLPWKSLASITIHESQLATHKLWDQYPRLDNRRFAYMLAHLHGATVKEEASFPSVRLWQKESKKYLNKAKLKYSIVPFSVDDRRKKFLLPQELVTKVYAWAKKKERILILHNEKESSVAKAMKALRLNRRNILINTTALFTQVDDTTFDRVIWIYPERAFTFPDFRSREHSVLLLARLQGLLKSKREVVLATRYPEFIEGQLSKDVSEVYSQILAERKRFTYPPYSDMVRLTFEDKSDAKVEKAALAARTLLEKKLPKKGCRILGPYTPLARKTKTKNHTQHILLLGSLDELVKAYQDIKSVTVDIDPQQVL